MQSVSAFHRVPTEVFRKIIIYAYSYERDSNNGEVPTDDDLIDIDFQVTLPPIGASRVCRSWRRTLVADPTMWTCLPIPHLSPRAIIRLLPRSGQSLLSVYLNLDEYLNFPRARETQIPEMLSVLLGQIQRIRLLHVRASNPHSNDRRRSYEALVYGCMSAEKQQNFLME